MWTACHWPGAGSGGPEDSCVLPQPPLPTHAAPAERTGTHHTEKTTLLSGTKLHQGEGAGASASSQGRAHALADLDGG